MYKRLLPSLGDYITNHGGQVNLSKIDVIFAEVGAIEDYVFTIRHQTEQRNKQRREERKQQQKNQRGNPDDPAQQQKELQPKPKVLGRAARVLEKNQPKGLPKRKKKGDMKIKSSHMQKKDNLAAALAMKQSLLNSGIVSNSSAFAAKMEQEDDVAMEDSAADVDGETKGSHAAVPPDFESDYINKNEKEEQRQQQQDDDDKNIPNGQPSSSETEEAADAPTETTKKRKVDDVAAGDSSGDGVGVVGDLEEEFDVDDVDDDDDDDGTATRVDLPPDVASPEAVALFKEKVKMAQDKKLDEYARNVEDKVRLHEQGWKDRYYSDKCKADDVAQHGGREHLFRSYVMGLVWVMKYYYDGCPSWKWYYPFHYAPFASDLRNIERFQKDVRSFEASTPFYPVEQLMAVLPSDSSHAIPKASRWLMLDRESPIIDFYPLDVPVDPNGKAMPWLWVVLLPFIDEDRLLAAM